VTQEIPFDVTLCLYRIAQEALQNVIKHSGASRAELGLFGDDRALTLQITDNGTGFDAAQASAKEGLGLLSMRERLRSLRGDITIVRRPTGGTQIDVKIPLGSPSQAEGCLKL
jgi:signal transduction histidine kinase